MMRTRSLLASLLTAIVAAAGCGERAKLSIDDTYGPDPVLVSPAKRVVPTVNAPEGTGWPADRGPVAAEGLRANAFATGLDHPRWLYLLPNGDVLVAETAAPPQPGDTGRLKGAAMKAVMKKMGAAVPSANRITLLRDADGDGVAELRSTLLEDLHSPFGMALVKNELYVANTDSVVKFPYRRGNTEIRAEPVELTQLPAGPINHHWTKNILPSRDGTKLYATVGSNSNVAERGLVAEDGRACIWEIDLVSGDKRIFATGLRNPNGLAYEPTTRALWTTVNERDEIGSDLVPDFMTTVRDGGFYGWPYSWYGRHVDERVKPQRPDLVETAIVPDYALGAHTAALGLEWSSKNALGEGFSNGMFVGQHGSWNRKPASGYQVVFVPFSGGRPSGPPRVVLSGFLSADEQTAYGRPVGVIVDKRGALLVADDVGNTIWRVAR